VTNPERINVMAADVFMEQIRHLLTISTILSLPVLGAALVVGLLIGLLQAITSIQEQTLSFIPKLMAIVLVYILLGSWMIRTMVEYTGNLFAGLPQFGAL
jgi:flagellar biosynthetic protein FliQ